VANAAVATRKIAEHMCLELNLFRQHEKRLPTTWSKTSGSTIFYWHSASRVGKGGRGGFQEAPTRSQNDALDPWKRGMDGEGEGEALAAWMRLPPESLKMFKLQSFVASAAAPGREFIFDVNLCNLWRKFNCYSGQLHGLLPRASNFKQVSRSRHSWK